MQREIYYLDNTALGLRLAVYFDETPASERPDRRSHEQAVTRQCLATLLGEEATVTYTENGAPLLSSHPDIHLSLSHCGNWYALALSVSGPVGIDVQEMLGDRLVRGKAYFMNEQEQEENWTERELYLIWGAKEALYKWKRGLVKSYKNDLEILEIGMSSINARVEGTFVRCAYQYPESSVVLVYSLPQA